MKNKKNSKSCNSMKIRHNIEESEKADMVFIQFSEIKIQIIKEENLIGIRSFKI